MDPPVKPEDDENERAKKKAAFAALKIYYTLFLTLKILCSQRQTGLAVMRLMCSGCRHSGKAVKGVADAASSCKSYDSPHLLPREVGLADEFCQHPFGKTLREQ